MLPAARYAAYLVVVLSAGIAVPRAQAQVGTQGHAFLTLMAGQGSGPFGSLASDVVAGTSSSSPATKSGVGWRMVGGYQFADYLGAQAGLARIGQIRTRANYGNSEQVVAEATVNILEVSFVGRLPIAPHARIDVTAGGAETSFDTSLYVTNGGALPVTQNSAPNVRRFGFTAGIDLEWQLTEHTSVLIGDHIYPRVGSSAIVGSARGTAQILGAGVNFEF
jgi:hypothetical protein